MKLLAGCELFLQALEGRFMLSVLLVAVMNTLGHVYCTHRHAEIDCTAAEKVWSQLQYELVQNNLAKIQVSRLIMICQVCAMS